MNDDKTYNGWSNYETWLANIWIDNEHETQAYWHEMTMEIWKRSEADSICSRMQRAGIALADNLKENFEEELEEFREVKGFWKDMLNAALSSVNWHEIAKAWLEECELQGELKDA